MDLCVHAHKLAYVGNVLYQVSDNPSWLIDWWNMCLLIDDFVKYVDVFTIWVVEVLAAGV